MSTTSSGRASVHERIVVAEEMKQSFRENGYATTIRPVVNDDELERMRTCYDGLYSSQNCEQVQRGLVQIFGAAQLAPDLISQELFDRVNDAAVELLAALDGVHPAYHSSSSQVQTRSATNTMGCICKPALTSEFTEFHQDEAYSPADVERWGVTAQLTLQCNDEESGQVALSADCRHVQFKTTHMRCGLCAHGLAFCGLFLSCGCGADRCMCFIPGSHKLPVLEHMVAPHQTFNPIDFSYFDELQLTPEAKDTVDFSTAVFCPVPAGALTFWTPRTLHGSTPNTSTDPRRTLLLGASYEAVPAAAPVPRPWQEQMTRSGASIFAGWDKPFF